MSLSYTTLRHGFDAVCALMNDRAVLEMTVPEIQDKLEVILRKANQSEQHESIPEILVLFNREGSTDSVTALKLIMEIEEAFGITVEDNEIRPENFETFSGLVRFVEAKVGR